MNKVIVGQIGEGYVIYKLGLIGIRAERLPVLRGIPDIVIAGNKTIEVKTSVLTKNRFKSTHDKKLTKNGWGFAQIRRSRADFVVLVMLNEDLTVHRMVSYLKSKYSSDVISIIHSKNYVSKSYRGDPDNDGIKNRLYLKEDFGAIQDVYMG